MPCKHDYNYIGYGEWQCSKCDSCLDVDEYAKTSVPVGKLCDIINKWESISAKQRGEWYNDCSSIDDMVEDIKDCLKGAE